MKKFFLFFLFSFSLYGNEVELFKKAIGYYNQMRYNDALFSFLEMLKNGYDNFEINYNIACCYYRLNEIGKARFFYEKALFFKPFDEDLIHNLKLIYNKIQEPQSDQILIGYKFLFFWPPFFIGVINIFLIIISGILILLFIKFNNERRLFLFLIIVFISISLLLFFLNIMQFIKINEKKLIVIKNNCNVYIAPNENESIILTVNEGYSNKIKDKINNFYKIKLPGGISGWIKDTDVISNSE